MEGQDGSGKGTAGAVEERGSQREAHVIREEKAATGDLE